GQVQLRERVRRFSGNRRKPALFGGVVGAAPGSPLSNLADYVRRHNRGCSGSWVFAPDGIEARFRGAGGLWAGKRADSIFLRNDCDLVSSDWRFVSIGRARADVL